ncbi:MAG: hypothetical protein HY727_13620 [Candidatus Rokubacteria bacterium]|nr:hypothetical protein [Candidatus Rokubacteria bacterium]
MSLLAFLFLLRVVGQALVAFLDVRWLPPMGEWYSGLLPYPLLLPSQIVILLVQTKISLDFARGQGVFVVPRPRAARPLLVASAVYFGAMVVRYAVSMTLHPERRWLGMGTIPIVFHWVLAAYLFTLGRYHGRAEPR